jgi:small-conductance mechanosensitive channel
MKIQTGTGLCCRITRGRLIQTSSSRQEKELYEICEDRVSNRRYLRNHSLAAPSTLQKTKQDATSLLRSRILSSTMASLVLALTWQLLFLLLSTDPVRYRLMMIPSMFEKSSVRDSRCNLVLPASRIAGHFWSESG